MQGTRTCTALAASVALLAVLAGCDGRVDHPARPPVPKAALLQPAPHAAADRSLAAAPAAPAQDPHAAVDGNVHSLGASGGTSVLDPDVLVAEQVKAALARRPEVGSPGNVDVSSRDGTVTLRGRVPDPQARERAAAIARSIRKVKDVDNQLAVG